MRVTFLKKNINVYSSNVYLIRGDWNRIEDLNTLIDAGADDFIFEELETISSGVGKKKIDQVILTHEHFDHTSGLKHIIERYNPVIYSFSKVVDNTIKVKDGMKIKVGDSECEILYTPGHSNDSICIYCRKEGILFTGDTAINIRSAGGSYTEEYLELLIRLSN